MFKSKILRLNLQATNTYLFEQLIIDLVNRAVRTFSQTLFKSESALSRPNIKVSIQFDRFNTFSLQIQANSITIFFFLTRLTQDWSKLLFSLFLSTKSFAGWILTITARLFRSNWRVIKLLVRIKDCIRVNVSVVV